MSPKTPLTAALALAALLGATGASSPTAPLRIAAVTGTAGACAPLEVSAPAGEKAYYEHLANRLGVKVQKCPVADAAGAAAALAAGQLDLAVLDPAAYAPIQKEARAILTVRPEGALSRVPVILTVLTSSPAKSLDDLRGKSIAFGGKSPVADQLPHKALADRGAGPGFFDRETIEANDEAAVARLRAGQVDAMALNASGQSRICPRVAANKPKPCADLKIVMRVRPQAAQALVIRRDMPNETHYRLIGIHVPMHLENKAAFAWASSWTPKAAEFEPTEALALLPVR